MKLQEFLEKINAQAKQLEMIGFKEDTLFTSMQQFVDKAIFRLDASGMNEDVVKVIKSFHEPKVLKVALEKYREMLSNGSINDADAEDKLLKEISK